MTAEAKERGSWLMGESLIGTRVGHLEVIAKAQRPPEAAPSIRGTWWMCKCRCGGEKVLPRQYIVQKTVLSCGCIKARKTERAKKPQGMTTRADPCEVAKKTKTPFGCLVYKTICPVCKKQFDRLSNEWSYKRIVGTHLRYYCSWKCFRA